MPNLHRGDRDQNYIVLGALSGVASMWILIVYVLIVLVGESIAIALDLFLDRVYPVASLPISLTLFFAVLWLSWVLAVRLTKPKREEHPKLSN
jgi:hypothetical protein